MAGSRKPGPIGIDGVDPIDEGTLCRSLSHPPGPTGTQHSHGDRPHTSKRHVHPQTERSTAKRARSTESFQVRYGDRGIAVKVMQALLNLHLNPGPNLKTDGIFGPKTLAALKRYQTAQHLPPNGIAGKMTWYWLTYTEPRKATPVAPAEPGKAAPVAQRPVVEDVATWSMPKRIGRVIRLLPDKLGGELWNQLMGLMSTDLIQLGIVLYGASHLFGVGELIDLGIGLIVGEQGVIELGDCIQITWLATSPGELDEAAEHLARAISIIGVYKFASMLMRFVKGRQAANTTPSTEATSQTQAAPPQSGEGSGAGSPRPGPQPDSPQNAPAASPKPAPAVRKLFRAVDTTELQSIQQSKGFTPSPNGADVKGFFFERADAQDFANKMSQMTGTPYSVVAAEAPSALVDSSPPHSAAGEGPGVYITNGNLPEVQLK